MSGAAVGALEGGAAPVPVHLSKEHGIMQAALTPRGDARTFLTHFVGGGLDDDRYVVEKFRSLANGEIISVDAGGTKSESRRRARGAVVTPKAVEKMRPARDEIIIATGVRRRSSQVQYWGWLALGIFADRRQRG